jgi:hypothetical protein
MRQRPLRLKEWLSGADLMRRYGPRCAVCDVRRPDLLQAAHLCPVGAGGSDDPRNGLVFCLNHHRAFDLGLLRIDPKSLTVHAGPDAGSLDELGVRMQSIGHLGRLPHPEALGWAWKQSGPDDAPVAPNAAGAGVAGEASVHSVAESSGEP